MRFRKRISLFPGVRLNLSGSGLSLSTGPRGASLTFGKKGIYRNLSIPGMGIYDRARIGGARSDQRSARGAPTKKELELERLLSINLESLKLSIPSAGGEVVLMVGEDIILEPDLQNLAWKYFGVTLQEQVSQVCLNAQNATERLSQIHLSTPPPVPPIEYKADAFADVPPVKPVRRPYHWFYKFFSIHRRTIDIQNQENEYKYEDELKEWNIRRVRHELIEKEKKALFESRDSGQTEEIEKFIAWRVSEIEWPRKTDVGISICPGASKVALDIDLPEIEDLPSGTPEPISKGRRVKWVSFSDTAMA